MSTDCFEEYVINELSLFAMIKILSVLQRISVSDKYFEFVRLVLFVLYFGNENIGLNGIDKLNVHKCNNYGM